MLLIATFMFEPAKLATNCVSASGASTRPSVPPLAEPAAACAPLEVAPTRQTVASPPSTRIIRFR